MVGTEGLWIDLLWIDLLHLVKTTYGKDGLVVPMVDKEIGMDGTGWRDPLCLSKFRWERECGVWECGVWECGVQEER